MPKYPHVDDVLASLKEVLETEAYSSKTVASYIGSVGPFLRYWTREGIPPSELDESHMRAYMTHVSSSRRLSPASRNLTASGIAFFFRRYLGSDAGALVERARRARTVPMVFSHHEAISVIEHLSGKYRLIARLLYGTGMRVGECCALRIKDLDFDLAQITVRDGKGAKDRHTVLPRTLMQVLEGTAARSIDLNAADQAAGGGWAALPSALHLKSPQAGYAQGWQFLFPSARQTQDPATGRRGRWHLHVSAVQRKIKQAIRVAGIAKPATTHTFRHTFATETLRAGYDVRTVQKLMGHQDLRVTMRYLHAIEQTGLAVRSPLDREAEGRD